MDDSLRIGIVVSQSHRHRLRCMCDNGPHQLSPGRWYGDSREIGGAGWDTSHHGDDLSSGARRVRHNCYPTSQWLATGLYHDDWR